jgi:thioredoxin 1
VDRRGFSHTTRETQDMPRQTLLRVILVAAVVAAAVTVYVLRPAGADDPGTVAAVDPALPRLLDLGADKCVPCKMMAPILEELRTEYAGRFEVVFVDVWKNPAAAEPYGLRVIPTQIFFAADGTELFRHEGFFGREDILKTWRELGIDIADAPDRG